MDAGKRIEHIWCFVAVDADGDEGLPAIEMHGAMWPLVASDERRRNILTHFAQDLATRTKTRIELRRFDGPFEVEEVFE